MNRWVIRKQADSKTPSRHDPSCHCSHRSSSQTAIALATWQRRRRRSTTIEFLTLGVLEGHISSVLTWPCPHRLSPHLQRLRRLPWLVSRSPQISTRPCHGRVSSRAGYTLASQHAQLIRSAAHLPIPGAVYPAEHFTRPGPLYAQSNSLLLPRAARPSSLPIQEFGPTPKKAAGAQTLVPHVPLSSLSALGLSCIAITGPSSTATAAVCLSAVCCLLSTVCCRLLCAPSRTSPDATCCSAGSSKQPPCHSSDRGLCRRPAHDASMPCLADRWMLPPSLPPSLPSFLPSSHPPHPVLNLSSSNISRYC